MANRKTLKRRQQRQRKRNGMMTGLQSLTQFVDERCNNPDCSACYPKENNMKQTNVTLNTNTGPSEEQTKRNYLENRLSGIGYRKEEQLRIAYGLMDDYPPETVKDLVERLTTGKYKDITDELSEEMARFLAPIQLIRWRDPAKKEDKEGYKTAREAMLTEGRRIKDLIMIKSPDDALTAIEAFEKAPVE